MNRANYKLFTEVAGLMSKRTSIEWQAILREMDIVVEVEAISRFRRQLQGLIRSRDALRKKQNKNKSVNSPRKLLLTEFDVDKAPLERNGGEYDKWLRILSRSLRENNNARVTKKVDSKSRD